MVYLTGVTVLFKPPTRIAGTIFDFMDLEVLDGAL
jgi:hypothetical protein